MLNIAHCIYACNSIIKLSHITGKLTSKKKVKMLLTPLQLLALNCSQFITDYFFSCRPRMNWDCGSRTFYQDTRRRHIWARYFVNYVVLGGVVFVGSFIFFMDLLLVKSEKLPTIEVVSNSMRSLPCLCYLQIGLQMGFRFDPVLQYRAYLWTFIMEKILKHFGQQKSI